MTKQANQLPPGVLVADTKYVSWEDRAKDAGDHGELMFYNTTGFGWCIATLQIRKARRSGQSDRTYAVRISDGAGVRIGIGPHVLATVRVHISKARLPALQKYVDLYQQGAVKANTTRDRISSRRAEGVERRAAGEYSWRWRT